MKSTTFNVRALISFVLASSFAPVIAQSLGENGTLPATTPLALVHSQLTTASTKSSPTNVSSMAHLFAQLEAVSNNTPNIATSPTLLPLDTIRYNFSTTTALSTNSTGASYTPSATVATALAPTANTLPTKPAVSTSSTSSYNVPPLIPLADAQSDTRSPTKTSVSIQNSSALSPIVLSTTGASSKPSTVPSGNSRVRTANGSSAPPTSSKTLPLAGTPATASYNSVMGQPTPTAQGGAMHNPSTPMTFATRPTGNPAEVSSRRSSLPLSLGTLPKWPKSSGVRNTNAPAISPLPFSSTAARPASPTVAAISRFTTVLLSSTQPGGATSNSPANMVPSLTTPSPIAPAIASFATMPSMTNKLEVGNSKSPAVMSSPLTSLRTNAAGNFNPKAEVSMISSSILENPSLQRAVTEVRLGYETSTRVVDGHITHDVFAKTLTTTYYVGTTDVKTTITTATSVTTVQPFPLPTEIPEGNRAKVDFGFGNGIPPGFYDRTIPMPAHSCPRDAITALARYRHFRRVTGQESGWPQPSIDKCCGIYKCNDGGWHCDSYRRIGIAPAWADYDHNNEKECRYWRTKNDAQYTFYMQNLHVLGLTDVDEKGWINEGPRKGQCCPEDGPPIDFGPHVAVKIIA